MEGSTNEGDAADIKCVDKIVIRSPSHTCSSPIAQLREHLSRHVRRKKASADPINISLLATIGAIEEFMQSQAMEKSMLHYLSIACNTLTGEGQKTPTELICLLKIIGLALENLDVAIKVYSSSSPWGAGERCVNTTMTRERERERERARRERERESINGETDNVLQRRVWPRLGPILGPTLTVYPDNIEVVSEASLCLFELFVGQDAMFWKASDHLSRFGFMTSLVLSPYEKVGFEPEESASRLRASRALHSALLAR